MSYGVETVRVAKNVVLDKRKRSPNWYARLTLPERKKPEVKSTKTDDLELARERALEMYYGAKSRITNGLPASTRKFKHVAQYSIGRMQDALDAGGGKQAYRDYISALREWLIPFFGSMDITTIDMAALQAFDEWREAKHGRRFSKSGINNHNAALNRVFDDAVMHKWMSHNMRPDLLNKGAPSESRGSFTDEEYKAIYTALRTFHAKTENPKAAATREVLRNYVLFLANTGVRAGREALALRWRNISWEMAGNDRYLVVNVDGKTKKRSLVARDTVADYLQRQQKLNPALDYDTLDDLIAAKSDEFVFTTRLGEVAKTPNLIRAFNALLGELGLKTGADDRERSLYSLRHYYATRDLKRGVTTHALSRQLGNSTAMLDGHYSKYSPMLNADVHSGRDMKRVNEKLAATDTD
ncbi:site-specific integrase [uncultured Tateyamaria sp.]|uniref:tyrosine-type recombinase/integrase n=1 Tax=uncultured Tateyamaria sp. TaxID=455651 RepID=UPI00261A77E0|nr:site-specific integrase [uncultured Tateyamaria sp.]